MSDQIDIELRVSGVTDVIVVLHQAAVERNGDAAATLRKNFTLTDASPAAALALDRGESPGTVQPMRYYEHLGVAHGTVDREGLSALLSRSDVVSRVLPAPQISLIRPRRTDTTRLTDLRTWGLEAMEVPVLWADGITGEGILVGHLDTGVDSHHPALDGAVAHFAAFDLLGEMIPSEPYDTDEHGTHTAGTIAGRSVRGRAIGVAPGARLASAIVIEGGRVVARVLGGMNWCVGLGVRVVSMSLGIRGYTEAFVELTRILRRRNILPVFAVGNEFAGSSRSPGNYIEALSVGAGDRQGGVADFSSSQRFIRNPDPIVPDLVAPGVGVISAAPGGGFQSMDGSSMATPHVAGLAALLLSAAPTATADLVEQAIFASCRRTELMPEERAGRGIPNAPRALAALRSAIP